jgi:hypothetical protein
MELDRCGHIGPAGHYPGSWVSERNSVLIKPTSPTSENKVPNRLVRWLLNRLGEPGNRLFAADDATAREHGWQIIPRHLGLSRQYRDPRFDMFTSCHWCHGSGGDEISPCAVCRGSGRVARPSPSHEQGGDDRDDRDPGAAAQ